MQFSAPLVPARLLRRYKRFLADVELRDGSRVTVHCPNTGSMLGCAEPGSRVWLSPAERAGRKYPYTWELVEVAPGVLVGINTGRTNALVQEAIESGVLSELGGYGSLRREVRFGSEGSRVDLLLEQGPGPECYVEVKNVTAAVRNGVAVFPDAVTLRGQKHLRELMSVAAQGKRAVLLFCVQRGDVQEVRPADAIDPAYGLLLRRALAEGVQALAYGARVDTSGVVLCRRIPVVCPPLAPH